MRSWCVCAGKERAFAPLGVVLVFVAVCDPFSARCLAGSTRWYADTLLWTRVALFSPWFMLMWGNARWLWIRLYGHGLRFRSSWYGASDGAVPGAPGSWTPSVSWQGEHVQAAWTCGFFRAMSTGTWPYLGASFIDKDIRHILSAPPPPPPPPTPPPTPTPTTISPPPPHTHSHPHPTPLPHHHPHPPTKIWNTHPTDHTTPHHTHTHTPTHTHTHTHHHHHHRTFALKSDRVSCCLFANSSRWPVLISLAPPLRCGGGSDGSAHGGDMSGCPSQQHWRKPTTTLRRRWGLNGTTLHGARRPPARGRGRES